jgi:hypothetical protein
MPEELLLQQHRCDNLNYGSFIKNFSLHYLFHLSPLDQYALPSATDELCCDKCYLVLINCILSLQNTNVDDGTGFINDLPLLKSEYLIFVSHFCTNNFYEPWKSLHIIIIIIIIIIVVVVVRKSTSERHVGITALNFSL